MQYSGLQVLSFVVLLLGTAAIVVSIATDYWSAHSGAGDWLAQVGSQHRGLWRTCTKISPVKIDGQSFACTNRLDLEVEESGEVNLRQRNITEWEIAVLALMLGSALLGVLGLLFSPCCCNRCGACLAFIVLLASLMCGTGLAIYAYYTKNGEAHTLDLGIAKIEVQKSEFTYTLGWSYWAAVGGGICQFVASFGFGAARARTSYSNV